MSMMRMATRRNRDSAFQEPPLQWRPTSGERVYCNLFSRPKTGIVKLIEEHGWGRILLKRDGKTRSYVFMMAIVRPFRISRNKKAQRANTEPSNEKPS